MTASAELRAAGMRAIAPVWLWPWCAFLFLAPFEALFNVADLATPFRLLGVGAAFLLALACPGRIAATPTLAVAFLVMALAISYFGSIDPAATRSALVPIGMAWLTYLFATAAGLDRGHFVASARAWLWGGSLASALALAAFAAGRTDPDGRLVPFLGPHEGDPNFFVAGLIFPFAIGMLFIGSRARRLEGLAAVAPILAAAALAQSRGGLLALAITLAVLLACGKRWKTFIATCLLVPALYLGFQAEVGRMDFKDLSGSRRTEIWPVGLDAGLSNWQAGTGMATFPRLTSSAGGLYWPRDAHSTYLQAFTEVGYPGLVGVLLVFGTHLGIRRRAPYSAPVLAGLAGTLVAGIFLHMLAFEILWLGWIVAAQTAAYQSRPVPLPVRAS
ncbi:MAG: O-antigen ligase family protein [Candidatus Sericytochromatia bacterium]|nr:O-antigen ligase family protein [Candidatus Tanganyikabacteria bacterium]